MEAKNMEGKLSQVLALIKDYTADNGYPPSVREIGAMLRVKSTATVHSYLSKLQVRGDITKTALKKRAVGIAGCRKVLEIPLVGFVHADELSPVEQVIDDNFSFSEGLFNGKNLFMLTVSGDCMKNAGIDEGDLAVFSRREKAENGEIVIALHENNAVIKRLLTKADGSVILRPENPAYKDIVVPDPQILGVLVGLIRRY